MNLVDRFIEHAKKTPYFDLPGYMGRWWVVKPRKWLPFSARVHHILRSDEDRDTHDHPWAYITIILKTGYWEVTPYTENDADNWQKIYGNYITFHDVEGRHFKKRFYGPGSILFRGAKSQHRLILDPGTTAHTLFIPGKHEQDWGFITTKGKVYWREYLNDWDSDSTQSSPMVKEK